MSARCHRQPIVATVAERRVVARGRQTGDRCRRRRAGSLPSLPCTGYRRPARTGLVNFKSPSCRRRKSHHPHRPVDGVISFHAENPFVYTLTGELSLPEVRVMSALKAMVSLLTNNLLNEFRFDTNRNCWRPALSCLPLSRIFPAEGDDSSLDGWIFQQIILSRKGFWRSVLNLLAWPLPRNTIQAPLFEQAPWKVPAPPATIKSPDGGHAIRIP